MTLIRCSNQIPSIGSVADILNKRSVTLVMFYKGFYPTLPVILPTDHLKQTLPANT